MTHDASASVTIKVTGQRVLNEEVCMVCTVTVDFEEEVDWPQEAESARTTAAPELALESLRSTITAYLRRELMWNLADGKGRHLSLERPIAIAMAGLAKSQGSEEGRTLQLDANFEGSAR